MKRTEKQRSQQKQARLGKGWATFPKVLDTLSSSNTCNVDVNDKENFLQMLYLAMVPRPLLFPSLTLTHALC